MTTTIPAVDRWPALPYGAWADTAETLHLWTQIVGKVRMESLPWQNHAWHVTLTVTPRGLTTGTADHEHGLFSISFDFFDHVVRIATDDGKIHEIGLEPKATAGFYAEVMEGLEAVNRPVTIHTMPNEIADAIPFDEDQKHDSYDGEAAKRFWRVLASADRQFRAFRSDWWGKSSPSHFFWGSFDLAVTRFSGREAPDHGGGLPNMPLWVAREAYSHEVCSAGFWPGNRDVPEPIFYAYAYPSPTGMAREKVGPEGAAWSSELGEYVLPYEAVRSAPNPDAALRKFLDDSFAVAAGLGNWEIPTGRRHFPPS
jgi:hypothetical protein